MSLDLRPQHCPDDQDSRMHLEPELKTCRTGHRIIEAAAEQVSYWLDRAAAALATGSVIETVLPHPNPESRAISLRSLDPTTCHVLVELSRQGSAAAAGLYVGLVCQSTSGAWCGAAGAYLQLCPNCNKKLTLKQSVAAANSVRLPSNSVEVPIGDWPSGLGEHQDWLAARELRLARLPGCEPQPWEIAEIGALTRRGKGALLVHTGAQLSPGPNLLLCERAGDLLPLLPVLASRRGTGQVLSFRRGALDRLRQVATKRGAKSMPPQQHLFLTARSRAPAGWGVLRRIEEGGATADITRTATTDVRDFRRANPASRARFDFWSAPQLSEGGAIDVSGLLALHSQLRG